ncbi:ribonuclease III [Methanobacterium formicicum]|uniref:ribonuclease III n=1 Tax=Methanobacterium formicicum (strain DSM 3637 / PP1) TaxID=1204725 RepID=K2RE10_METFP|nr:ribonuclease III [Methanobacterium formicicum]EKF86584.1 ribonuclease 3 [Methanobacterium formicicum DSM 3637]
MRILEKFSITPKNLHLYDIAFLHESYSYENNLNECYERLEFLGDAVLDLVVSEFLYESDQDLDEGELTRLRANYVCNKALYTYSMDVGLNKYVKLGAGAELSRRELHSVTGDVFEAFIGALYLDLGLGYVKKFLSQTVLPHIDHGDIFFYDYKSELQQLSNKDGFSIIYELLNEKGEPHKKIFTMAAMIDGKNFGEGGGGSKKEAQQNAAKEALKKL